MANADLIAPMPQIDLGPGMIVRLEAIDATTGAQVAGVAIADATLYARSVDVDTSELAPLEPVYLLPAGN